LSAALLNVGLVRTCVTTPPVSASQATGSACVIDMPRMFQRVTAEVFDEDVEVNPLSGWRAVLTTS
jgi:hypothetical protein